MYYRKALMLQAYLERMTAGGWCILAYFVLVSVSVDHLIVCHYQIQKLRFPVLMQLILKVLSCHGKLELKQIWSLHMLLHVKFMENKKRTKNLRLLILHCWCKGELLGQFLLIPILQSWIANYRFCGMDEITDVSNTNGSPLVFSVQPEILSWWSSNCKETIGDRLFFFYLSFPFQF